MSNHSVSILSLLAPHRRKVITAVTLQFLATALGLIPFILVYLIAKLLLSPPVEQGYIWQLAIASLIAIICKWILSGIAGSFAHITAYNVLYDLRLQLSEKLGSLSLGYFNSRSTGALKKVMNEDVEHLELTIAHGIPEGTGTIATFLLTTIYLFTVDWRMTLAALAGLPVAILSQQLMFKSLQPFMTGYFASQDRMNSTIVEYIQGMPVIKAFTQTTESFGKYQNSVREYHEFEEKWTKVSLIPWTLFTMSIPFSLLVMLPVGVWLLEKGSLSIPTFILFLLLGLGMTKPLVKLIESSDVYLKTQEGLTRIAAILDEPAITQPKQSEIPNGLAIAFQDVSFGYEDKQVIHNLDLVIPQGKITALVGPSGSGKSTIAKLIARFWEIDSGKITLGGVELRNLTTEYLMSQLAFVFQDVLLFNETIYENIRMGKPNATNEEVIAAAKIARCHEFISTMPDGYETSIGERGAKLSGGQKQRISIARAILKDAPIVILDEATAFIDPENESIIQQAISALVQNKTLLIIAHRLSTIAEADSIVVLDRGHIVAQGKHQELLAQCELYHHMWLAHVAAQGWTFEGQETLAVGN
ncbi:ABC transporter HlyB/MsbA family protein [Hyella patelloides LEGE 07179]|uniref:ABC transporter HlyB/MsbA family protein n=1 Tax=Hyella patelloides LEGE 07179 TaxID=945734 RepID=A0A563W1H8_9CYAN|nr:ABC transporter ATP-binding protein [Hyella patelloides]VEP17548.1 ABC transporter HlyB/MsbA family protein [Hyella patelloides LEGE 07179]